jgi:formylglycine-generating enzyme required for sulfatase activity
MMGSNDDSDDEKPVHEVYVDDFYMDKYEVTVEQYQKFLNANPSQTKPDRWNEQLQHSYRILDDFITAYYSRAGSDKLEQLR